MNKISESKSGKKNLKHHVLKIETGHYSLKGFPVTPWIEGNFAEFWYEDTKREANIKNDINARRREIIFSICFAETYLFEWTRGKVEKNKINEYFPYEDSKEKVPAPYRHRWRRSLIKNWKKLLTELFKEGKIGCDPKLKTTDFKWLIEYRNHLVHAHVSRPRSPSQPPESNPKISPEDINKLSPGRARDIVKTLVLDLHNALGSKLPDYL